MIPCQGRLFLQGHHRAGRYGPRELCKTEEITELDPPRGVGDLRALDFRRRLHAWPNGSFGRQLVRGDQGVTRVVAGEPRQMRNLDDLVARLDLYQRVSTVSGVSNACPSSMSAAGQKAEK
jgi:hypothetical protein